MNQFLKNFFKGILIGLLLLPFELLLLTLKTDHLVQAQDLREEIRSQVADPREIRGEIPCEEDPREGCARPIPPRPTHRPCCEETPSPSAPPLPSILPLPTQPPLVTTSPAPVEETPTPSPGVGGPKEEEEEEKAEEAVEAIKVLPITSGD